MRLTSLRLRLLVIAAAVLTPALGLAWFGLALVFERHVERRYLEQLDIHVESLAARATVGPGGELALSRPLSDPRFELPLSGLYWRLVDEAGDDELSSRSLWDRVFIDAAAHPEPAWRGQAPAPDGRGYLLVQRRVRLGAGEGARPIVIQAAMDDAPLEEARSEFAGELGWYLAALGGALAILAAVQVQLGLRPLERLRSETEALGRDPAARIPDRFPDEVRPLIQAINQLLENRAAAITAAYARAGDLAHGLKTPLAVLRSQAEKLGLAGQQEAAQALDAATRAMEAKLSSELSRARAAASVQSGLTESEAAPLVDRLIAVASRTPAGERLDWDNRVVAGARLPLAEPDLADALGPLLENAARWAKTSVVVSQAGEGLVVEDDGPGLTPKAREAAAQRGVRLDRRGEGSGLGLAIAAEILAEYGWVLKLGRSPLGGLSAALLPEEATEAVAL